MERKTYVIPGNVDAQFEVFGLTLKETLIFLPSIAISVLLILLPIPTQIKIMIPLILMAVPFMMIKLKPQRYNIPVWKHLKWRLDYEGRNRRYYYRKEGYKHVQRLAEATGRKEAEETGSETETVSTRIDPGEIRTPGIGKNTG